MSDDLLDTDQYGKAATEAGMGYQAMPDTRPVEADNAERANAERTIDRLNTPPEPGSALGEPLSVEYHQPNADGTRSDKLSPENLTTTPERAAKDLADWRRGSEDIQRAIEDAALSAEIDALRSGEAAQSQQPQAPTEPVALDQQAQQPEPTLPPGFEGQESEELVRAFRENPKLLEAMTAYSWQTDQRIAAAQQQALQYAEMQKQQAEQFVQANSQIAWAQIFSRFPEVQPLANMNPQQQQAALAMFAQSNPQRFQEFHRDYTGMQQLFHQANQVQQQQQQRATQQYQQHFHTWGGEEDSKFVKAHPEMADNATASGVTQRTRAYVHNKGFSDDDIARAWSGQAHLSLRDARVQSMLYDAMRYREALAAVPAARANKPAKVQVPGPTGQRLSEDESGLRDLNAKLNSSHSVRDAANLLIARSPRYRGNK